jgi:hypothetical protein
MWGDRASRLVAADSAGKMPAGPTAKMAVLLRFHRKVEQCDLNAC